MSRHLDSKGNEHANAADAAQADSIYNTEKYAKQQRTASAVTAAATTATALYAKKQAEEAERTARFALEQSYEAKKQTAIIEQKAEFDRLVSFLENETDKNKWETIYPYIAEGLKGKVTGYGSHKLYQFISKSAKHRKIKKNIETVYESKQKLEKLKTDFASFAEKIRIASNGRIENGKAEDIKIPNLYKTLGSYRTSSCAAGTLFLILALASQSLSTTLRLTILLGWIPFLITNIFRNKINTINTLKTRLAELDSEHKNIQKTFRSGCKSLENSTLINQSEWNVTEHECFTFIELHAEEFQKKLPRRCRVQLTEEITKSEIHDLIDRTHCFIRDNFVATLLIQQEKQTES